MLKYIQVVCCIEFPYCVAYKIQTFGEFHNFWKFFSQTFGENNFSFCCLLEPKTHIHRKINPKYCNSVDVKGVLCFLLVLQSVLYVYIDRKLVFARESSIWVDFVFWCIWGKCVFPAGLANEPTKMWKIQECLELVQYLHAFPLQIRCKQHP